MRLMIEPLRTERNWCGSIVSGVDGSAIVSTGLRACARVGPGLSTATAAAAPPPVSTARRVGIGLVPPGSRLYWGRESAPRGSPAHASRRGGLGDHGRRAGHPARSVSLAPARHGAVRDLHDALAARRHAAGV